MRFNKLDLNQLVVLDALLEERSVQRAARRLHLSAPATSNALGRLRDYFQDEILVQVGHSMTLTPRAEILRQPVRDVLLRVQSITQVTPTFDAATSTRRLRLQASDYMVNVFLGRVLQRASVLAPHMSFDLRLLNQRTHAEFENGEIDLLFTSQDFSLPDPPKQMLFSDTWSCLAWADNRAVGYPLTLDQYLSMRHVVIDWSTGRLPAIDTMVADRLGFQRCEAVSAPNFTCVPPLLVGTRWICTIQTRLAESLARAAPLRVVPCPMTIPPLVEVVQWHPLSELDPAICWFKDLAAEVALALPSPQAPAQATH